MIRNNRPDDWPVLIVAPPGDEHALVVAARIKNQGVECGIWDSARLPSIDHLTVRISRGGRREVILESTSVGQLDLEKVRAIWWRRVRTPTIASSVSDRLMRSYCKAETDHLLRGALSSVATPVFNEPDAELRASRKPYQLMTAASVGLTVPDTLITCSSKTASLFCDSTDEPLIIKPFRTPADRPVATQAYDKSKLSEKHALLSNSPVVFQERLEPYKDVRVAVIGNRVFGAVSESRMLDWRIDATVLWRSHELPSAVINGIRVLMRKLGLTLGQLDFRVTPDGHYVFLEVNPSGQFLFLEVDDPSIALSSEIASLLIRGAPRYRRSNGGDDSRSRPPSVTRSTQVRASQPAG